MYINAHSGTRYEHALTRTHTHRVYDKNETMGNFWCELFGLLITNEIYNQIKYL